MTRSLQRYILCGVVGVLLVGLANSAPAQECDPVEVAKLIADDSGSDRRFGNTVSFDGDTAVIGTPFDSAIGHHAGSAYVFTRSDGIWTQQAKLLPADGAGEDRFGFSVALSGDTAVIGAFGDQDNGIESGSAYVFTRSGGVWTEQTKLIPADGAERDTFGVSVSLSDDTAVIGAYFDDDNGSQSGSAYVFTRSGGVWTQESKLLPDDGEEGDMFGYSVSISGDTALIGARNGGESGSHSGSAYVFTRSGDVWTQQAKILPVDVENNDDIGVSVSLNGDMLVVGAPGDNDNGTQSGSAYVFTRSEGIWTQQQKLLATDGTDFDRFGDFVSINGGTTVIGAYADSDNGEVSGSAYIFSRSGSVWTQQAKLLPSDGTANDHFGQSISINGNTALIGAKLNDDTGAVYVFDLGCIDCPADLNGDGVVNTQDFLAFLGAWSAGDPLADWNEDGLVNTQDFLAYLGDWAAGC